MEAKLSLLFGIFMLWLAFGQSFASKIESAAKVDSNVEPFDSFIVSNQDPSIQYQEEFNENENENDVEMSGGSDVDQRVGSGAEYDEESDDTEDELPPVDERCPAVSEVAQRRQSIFQHMIRRWRLNIESQQPWEAWSRKIIKCSLGKQLYRALGPESKIQMTENIRAVLKRELSVRQHELAKQEMQKNPCHPFLAERGMLKAILKFRASMVLARKPVIYLYPHETPINVNVTVKITDGEFTTLYPKFNSRNQWEIEAQPCGSLTDLNTKRKYKYLFWEARRPIGFSVQDGQCVKREETEEFLEKALSSLGLNDQEKNDFMVYWLPELEKNPFNLISFSTQEYNTWSQLEISPPPKTLIRIFMTFSPLQTKIASSPLSFPSVPLRTGFTVVEWGGSEIPRQ